ncbi:MAG TPA: glycosyltransferase family A protein [Bryobacteraceae bacterium]|nr:glycosyltransferase family A protein [Bryobacteraceae bacterium]
MPRVTAIIPAYNTARFLPYALESVLRQTYADWEAVLVDDGSTDNTRELVAEAMPKFGGRLQYVYQPNRGLPAARNTAIRHAKGELIALLDADDIWEANRLQLGVEMMDLNPRMGLTHAKVARIDVDGRFIEHPPAPPRKYLEGSIAKHIYSRRAHLLCPTILFRRSCLDRVGVFDETMRATEDRDLWFRIAEHYEIGYIDEVIAQYRVSPNSMSKDWQRMRTWQTYFIDKHYNRGVVSRWMASQARASICRERGDTLYKSRNLGESVRWYFDALRCYPFRAADLYMFSRALLEFTISKTRPAAQPLTND